MGVKSIGEKKMISGTLPISREDSLLHKLGIVLLAICIAVPVVFGFWKIPLAALFLAALLLYFRRIEDRFLFWLLTFSLFSVDSMTFLSVGGHPILSFDRVFIAILLFIFLKEIVLNERRPLRISSIEVIYLLLLFLMGLHIMFITLWQKAATRYFVDAFFLPFVVFIIAKNCLSEKEHFVKFAKTLFVVGIYISLMAVYEYLTGHDLFIEPIYGGLRLTEEQWLRVNGPYQMDYVLGLCCLICFFVALYKYSITKKTGTLHHIFYISTLTVITIATFLSFYRGIWLAWALGLFTWFITRKRGLGKLTFALLALAILVVPFIAALQTSDFYGQRIANIETIEFRLERFGAAWSMFKEHPIFGIGFRNYNALTGTTEQQHNQILAFLSETGIIGASLYVALLFMLLYHAVKRYKSTNDYTRKEFIRAFLCILFAIVFLGFGLNTGFDKPINLLFFAVAGVALSSPRKQLLKGSTV